MRLTKAFSLILLVPLLADLPAQTPTRLTTGGLVSSSNDSRIVDVGGVAFFGDSSANPLLWKSAGTVASTASVRSFAWGLWGDRMRGGEWHGELLFGANDGPIEYLGQLWRSNGTAAGTTLVAQVGPSLAEMGSRPQLPTFVRLGSALCFYGSDETTGGEPWRTDGTTAGTYRLRDINPGPVSSGAGNFTAFKGHIYFSAYNGSTGATWRTDGTIAGTQVFSSISSGGSISNFAVLGDYLLLPSTRFLYRTDGTTAGTVLVATVSPTTAYSLGDLTVVGNQVFFSAYTTATGRELWKTDGTTAGTVLVRDINPGSANSNPVELTALNGRLLFQATSAANGRELWQSDGTAAGTFILKEFNPGTASGDPGNLVAVGSRRVYFSANDGATGNELWRTDGTAAGTIRLADTYPGPGGGGATCIALAGGQMYFKAFTPAGGPGMELFVFDPGATSQAYGYGCAATSAQPTLACTDPVLGAAMTLSGTDAPAPLGLLMLGAPTRAGLPYGPGCRFWIDLSLGFVDLFVFPVGGTWSLTVTVPNDSGLTGLQLGAQVGFPQSGAPLNIAVSNGVVLRFGT